MIPLGAWTPDQSTVYAPHLTVAKNVIPKANSYAPLRALTNGTEALAARPYGAASFRDAAVTSHFFAGSATKLYELQNDGSWTEVTRSSGGDYATTGSNVWEFAKFGDLCIATNFNDDIQVFTMSSSSNFAALGGSPPNARHIATFGDFVVLGYTDNSPFEVKWSGINDATSWTPGTDQSDAQTLPDGGIIRGFASGDTLTVFQQNAIRRMQYVGPPVYMQFDKISEDIGCLASGSICEIGAIAFFLATDGFYMTDGSAITPISSDLVDDWFFTDVNQEYLDRMTSAVDPQSKVAYWSYASTAAVTGIPDTLLMYNWTAKRWSYARITVERLVRSFGLGYTLDGLDSLTTNIDNFDVPLDDPSLTGGALQLGGFGSGYQFGPFSGDTLESEIVTGDFELNPKRRSYVSAVEPVIDTTSVTVAVSGRERLGDAVSYDDAQSLEVNGTASADSGGRYHRVKIVTEAGADWDDAISLDFEAQDDGET